MSRPNPPPAKEGSNLPVHTLRHRNIKAAIWKNQTAKGDMYNVTVIRSYKEDDMWRDSHSFSYDDLMNVAKLLYDAHSYISTLRAKAPPAAERPPKRRERPNPQAG